MRIYTFLLDHFTDEQRFNITTMISDNILGKGLPCKIWPTKSCCLYKSPSSRCFLFLASPSLLLQVK